MRAAEKRDEIQALCLTNLSLVVVACCTRSQMEKLLFKHLETFYKNDVSRVAAEYEKRCMDEQAALEALSNPNALRPKPTAEPSTPARDAMFEMIADFFDNDFEKLRKRMQELKAHRNAQRAVTMLRHTSVASSASSSAAAAAAPTAAGKSSSGSSGSASQRASQVATQEPADGMDDAPEDDKHAQLLKLQQQLPDGAMLVLPGNGQARKNASRGTLNEAQYDREMDRRIKETQQAVVRHNQLAATSAAAAAASSSYSAVDNDDDEEEKSASLHACDFKGCDKVFATQHALKQHVTKAQKYRGTHLPEKPSASPESNGIAKEKPLEEFDSEFDFWDQYSQDRLRWWGMDYKELAHFSKKTTITKQELIEKFISEGVDQPGTGKHPTMAAFVAQQKKNFKAAQAASATGRKRSSSAALLAEEKDEEEEAEEKAGKKARHAGAPSSSSSSSSSAALRKLDNLSRAEKAAEKKKKSQKANADDEGMMSDAVGALAELSSHSSSNSQDEGKQYAPYVNNLTHRAVPRQPERKKSTSEAAAAGAATEEEKSAKAAAEAAYAAMLASPVELQPAPADLPPWDRANLHPTDSDSVAVFDRATSRWMQGSAEHIVRVPVFMQHFPNIKREKSGRLIYWDPTCDVPQWKVFPAQK